MADAWGNSFGDAWGTSFGASVTCVRVFQLNVFQNNVFQVCPSVVPGHVFQCNVFQNNVFQGVCGAGAANEWIVRARRRGRR